MNRTARLALVLVPSVVALGSLSGLASNSGFSNAWFAGLAKPAFMPPGWAFPVAWTALYALIAVALAMVMAVPSSRARGVALGLFAAQFALNLAWSPVFFALHQPRWALAVIVAMLALALLAALAFHRLRRAAGWLMLPYLAWLVFAATLNAEIIRLN